MTEAAPNPWPSIPEEDLLAYSHVQSLSQIQDQIQALRTAIPALLSPLLPATSSTVVLPRRASVDVKLAGEDRSVEFRKQATKVQGDVKSLVTNLEKICETLEAAEKVRNADYNEKGELVRSEPLQRTNVVREEVGQVSQDAAAAAAAPISAAMIVTDAAATNLVGNSAEAMAGQDLAAPLAGDAYMFGDAAAAGTEAGAGLGAGDLMTGDLNMDVFGANGYADFEGLEAYGNDWADMNFSGEAPPSTQ